MIKRTWGAAVLRPYMIAMLVIESEKARDLGNDRGYRVAGIEVPGVERTWRLMGKPAPSKN